MLLKNENIVFSVQECVHKYLLIDCLCCPSTHIYPKYVHVNILLTDTFPTRHTEYKTKENETGTSTCHTDALVFLHRLVQNQRQK